MLAGLIASPAAYSPVQNPAAALERRNLVLQRMHDQGLITSSELRDAERQALPPRSQIRTAEEGQPVALLHAPGSRTSSSTATAAGTPSAAG